MSKPWTDEQKKYVLEAMAHIKRMTDLLTPEEQASLNADLAEMARIRRRAEAESANIVIGGSVCEHYHGHDGECDNR